MEICETTYLPKNEQFRFNPIRKETAWERQKGNGKDKRRT